MRMADFISTSTHASPTIPRCCRTSESSPQPSLCQVAKGIELPTLGKDELFAYLAVHGASSAWFRLKWITDFAALLHGESADEIERLYARSQQLGAGRAAAQALLLAEQIYGIGTGDRLHKRLRGDPVNRWLERIAEQTTRRHPRANRAVFGHRGNPLLAAIPAARLALQSFGGHTSAWRYCRGGEAMSIFGWYQVKLFIEHASGISMDALHILAGFILFLIAARLLRTAVSSPLPWLTLLVLELVNEAYDLHVELWPNLGSQLGEGAKDILLTMALPTLLLAAARLRPQWLGPRSADAGPSAGE